MNHHQPRPNTRMQRTRSSPSARRSPLMRCPLGGPKLSVGLAFAFGMLVALGVGAQALTGDSQFISRATITLERNDRRCPDPNGGAMQLNWVAVDLTEKQVSLIRQTLLDALKGNKADEKEAARHNQVGAGVPGCVSYDFRLTLQLKDVTQKADLHLCAGWVRGEPRIGDIVFSEKQKARLQKVLGEPCR